LPFVPQLAAPWSLQMPAGSAVPFATVVHVPSVDGSAQLRHAPVQPLSQQTPSTQNPDLHSVPLAHGCPGNFGPQVLFTQAMPVSQSVSTLQVPVHWPSTQRKGEQFCSEGGLQVPSPSQTCTVFSLLPEQLGAAHCVSTA
jgi:hypothetical protein